MAYLNPYIERTSPHRRAPPPRFYLVQHCDSARRRVPERLADGTFESRAHCEYKYGRWVTASRLAEHFDPWTKSPFISLFDNEDAAIADGRRRKKDMKRHDHIHVFTVKAATLLPTHLHLSPRHAGTQLHLPVWSDGPIRRNDDRLNQARVNKHNCGLVVFSMTDATQYLGLSSGLSTLSQWFALDFVPGRLTEQVHYAMGVFEMPLRMPGIVLPDEPVRMVASPRRDAEAYDPARHNLGDASSLALSVGTATHAAAASQPNDGAENSSDARNLTTYIVANYGANNEAFAAFWAQHEEMTSMAGGSTSRGPRRRTGRREGHLTI